MIYRHLFQPLLFRIDAEQIHDRILKRLAEQPWLLSPLQPWANYSSPLLAQRHWGLAFRNPIGLAAGFDKFGVALAAWNKLGFGFAEIGTITGSAQPGNEKPRLFRLPADGALINRFGFNNDGAEITAKRMSSRSSDIPIGVNIGKTKTVDLQRAVEDYVFSFQTLWNVADYFVINVSSPNTPNLRQLQEKSSLLELLNQLSGLNRKLSTTTGAAARPVLVKIAPDLSRAQLDDLLEVVGATGVSGIVATNTTITRENLHAPEALAAETGGLSGKPIARRSTEVIRYIKQQMGGKVVVIGVGGVFTADDAYDKIKAGASLIQVYTGFVYQGPLICRQLNRGLDRLLRRDGLRSITEAIGVEASA
ncbi:MAG: quinone-dependent dihydroorotate dehydrogenase [Bacteroidetes bacterium]|nr:quinone-dependent dihydroorotate dehydrogenase [Bacteroidota bacterium]